MKMIVVMVVLCVNVVGCGNHKLGPAEDILHNDYTEGGLTMWAYDVREKPMSERREIKQKLLADTRRIMDAYLLIGCTNQAQFSRLSERFDMLIEELSSSVGE